MLSTHGRIVASALLKPVALFCVRLGLSPDAVSIGGTVGVAVAALVLIPSGHLAAAALVVAAFALTDTVDGLMARELHARGVRRSTDFGAFLDSTLDRVADGAVFAGLVLWAAMRHSMLDVAAALACLVLGSVVPYARARAEGLGMTASGGIAERADRLVAVLVAMLITGLGGPGWLLSLVLVLLAVASGYTVFQRVSAVRAQAERRLATELAADSAARPWGTQALEAARRSESASSGDLERPELADVAGRGALPEGIRRPTGALARRWVRMSATRPRRDIEPWLARRARRRTARPRRGR